MVPVTEESVIPSFNISDLLEGKHQTELRDCLVNQGVFFVSGVDIDHEPALSQALNLFKHGTAEEKRSVSHADPKQRRGFTALESESTSRITNEGNYTDYSMCYSMGTRNNLFPNAEFESKWTDYFNKMNKTALQIASCLELNNFDIEDVTAVDPLFRLRFYPEVPSDRVAEQEPLRMAPHYDISIVTLINQTPCPNGFVSLRVLTNGKYMEVPAERGMLVLCGAVATIMSNGKIKAPMHHVAAPDKGKRIGSSRSSAVFFLRPDSSFRFDTDDARSYGLNVSLPPGQATFGQWIGDNYVDLRNKA